MAQMEAPSNLPTEEVTKTKTVSGSPTTFNITEYYPNVERAFGTANFNWIKELVNILNQGLYYSSNGQVQFKWMQDNRFNFTTSNIPSEDLKFLMKFCQQIHDLMFMHNGENLTTKPFSPDEIKKKTDTLKVSPNLTNLSTTNPMGQLQSKLGQTLKSAINDTLLKIK